MEQKGSFSPAGAGLGEHWYFKAVSQGVYKQTLTAEAAFVAFITERRGTYPSQPSCFRPELIPRSLFLPSVPGNPEKEAAVSRATVCPPGQSTVPITHLFHPGAAAFSCWQLTQIVPELMRRELHCSVRCLAYKNKCSVSV